ncbi:hypothetical protein [Rhodococcus sp. OK302]|uniref:hypothetical protein n=1 Tax=Rhodococcus sp. OK302 TaxID=1882769 RepID=UPI0011409245|nr:hypothetical protein [Rhodococcus sp. OK302]
MKVEFIDRHKGEHGAAPICDTLENTDAAIAPSTYYGSKTRPESARSIHDRELSEQIATIHDDNYSVHGAGRSMPKCAAKVHRWPNAR